MALIERRSIVAKAQRAFGVKSGVGFGATVSDEVVMVSLIDDVTGPGLSADYPRGASKGNQVAAVAAQVATSALLNPTTSGVCLELRWLYAAATLPFERFLLRLFTEATITANLTERANGNFDDASLLTEGAAGQIWDGTNGAQLGTAHYPIETTAVDGIVTISDVGVVIPPGFGYGIINENLNDTLNYAYRWTEHLIGDGQVE